MKSKLKFLTKVSIDRKIKSKWFKIANIILALLIVALANIDNIINLFGGDFDKPDKIYVVDTIGDSFDIFSSNLEATMIKLDRTNYTIEKDDEYTEEDNEKLDNEKAIYFIFDGDNYTIITNGYMETLDYQIYSSIVNSTKTTKAILSSDLNEEEVNALFGEVEINRIILDETKKSEDENMSMMMTTIFPIVILPFFMLSLLLIQMIGAEINDEKTTRGMEIIISNVSAKTHFISKMLSGILFVLLQAGLLLLYSGLGLLVRFIAGNGTLVSGMGGEISGYVNDFISSGAISSIVYIIPFTLILMIITLVAYALLAGILASATTNAEDFNQLQTPLVMVSLVGYYLSMMAGVFDGSIIIRALSYFPLISAILSPSLLVLGQIGIIDVMISMAIMIGFVYLLIKYGLKIYKVGILNYSSKNLWKMMFKALKDE